MPERSEAWEEGFLSAHGLLVAVMVGKAWWQEWETEDHTLPAVRRQRERNAGPHMAFPFLFSTRSQTLMVRTVDLISQLTSQKSSFY